MSVEHVRDAGAAEAMARVLEGEPSIALDCEAAGFHRYSDRLCLVQISTPSLTFVVDPLAFDPSPHLRPPLEDPGVRILMHGADFDIRLLDRDMDVQLKGLFDTQVAASLLGEPGLGLSALLERHLGVRLSKKHQRADWAQRPLPPELLAYAADDTRHLHRLAAILEERLREAGRLEWAREEFRLLETIRWEEDPEEDPVTRVKGARDLEPGALQALREALDWRDRIAREQDRAPFRVAGDTVLVEAVQRRPSTVDELAGMRGMSQGLARGEGQALLEAIERGWATPASSVAPYPRPEAGVGRPPPEVEERARALKVVRNRRAKELGIDRGALIPNATLLEIAREEPRSREALIRVPGVKEWQVEAAGEHLLAALNGGEGG